MPGHRKSLKPDTKKQTQQKKEAENPETNINSTDMPEDGDDAFLSPEESNWSDQMGSCDQDESGCGACTQLLKGSITTFMTSDKFLEKYPERIEGFNLYDYHNDGYINSDDLGSALAAVGYIVSEGELAVVSEHLNINRGTDLHFSTFTAVIAHQIMACSDAQIMDAFRMFDKEGRGTIDAKELKHITTVLGVQTDEEQIDDMVREVDVDGDGDIDFQEFVMMIRK
ncbi:uncharacterized protein LOC134817938 [Bolinopsis microptera]|uniref:uncharacterized protein LOC134817938 n=1 Tax=Bolinopsis microptera TaxID=2820187 RepID=UPI00307A115D